MILQLEESMIIVECIFQENLLTLQDKNQTGLILNKYQIIVIQEDISHNH